MFDVNVHIHLIVMDNDTASESNKPVDEGKTENSILFSVFNMHLSSK